MSWDSKKRGPSTGYFYESQRIPGKPHPVKRYRGRGGAGHLAAALVDARRRERRAASETVRAEAAATADADRLAEELAGWAQLLATAWLVATGHRDHKGSWRKRRG